MLDQLLNRAHAVDDPAAELPKPLAQWRQELAARHLAAAKAAAADRDKAVAAIRKEMQPHVTARDKAQAELNAARAYVANVPLDAAVEEVATQSVIADQWPRRVAALNETVNGFQARINAAETAFSYALNHAQVELDLEHRDALRLLNEVKPNLAKMMA